MIQSILLKKDATNPAHTEVIDVCEKYAEDDDRTATSALLRFVKASPLYKEALARLKNNGHCGKESSRD